MTRLPLSVINNIPSGDSCKVHDDFVCKYWAEGNEQGISYCVVQQKPLRDYEKTRGINK